MALGLFGIGSQKQMSTSSSQQSSYGQSQSSSLSGSSGFSQSGSTDSVFGADLFRELFGGASAAAAGLDPSRLTMTANRLFDSGAGFIDQLAELGGAGGVGEQYLAGQLTGGDALLDEQIAGLQSDLGEFFNETVMPGIRSDAIAAGALGGGREGVAAGIAGKGLLSEFQRGATGLRVNAQATRNSIAQTLAQMQTQRRLSAAGAGLAALPGQFQLAEAGSFAALSPFAMLASILGGPTVLTDSFGVGGESAFSRSDASASETSSGSSSSYSKGSGFQFNLGAA